MNKTHVVAIMILLGFSVFLSNTIYKICMTMHDPQMMLMRVILTAVIFKSAVDWHKFLRSGGGE